MSDARRMWFNRFNLNRIPKVKRKDPVAERFLPRLRMVDDLPKRDSRRRTHDNDEKREPG